MSYLEFLSVLYSLVMYIGRTSAACLVLILAHDAQAIELTIDPDMGNQHFGNNLHIAVPMHGLTEGEIKVFFPESKQLRTIKDTLISFEIEQLGYNTVRDLEFGILGLAGEKTLFDRDENETIASQSHNEHLQLPANTVIYGVYFAIEAEISFNSPTEVQFYLNDVLPANGDYNSDGVVDAADYVVWRSADGSPEGHAIWRSNFGQSELAGSGSSSIVPEPTTLLLLAMISSALFLYRRRQPVPYNRV